MTINLLDHLICQAKGNIDIQNQIEHFIRKRVMVGFGRFRLLAVLAAAFDLALSGIVIRDDLVSSDFGKNFDFTKFPNKHQPMEHEIQFKILPYFSTCL